MTIAGQIPFLLNFFRSMWKGPKAGANPWDSTSLEWIIPSPPPHDNFGDVEPVVYHGPYEYSVPGVSKDFVMQTEPTAEVGGAQKP
jgi:cytochrome c oxidase subunit 1